MHSPNLPSANNQQNPFPPNLLNASTDGSMPFSGMDPYAAKQMAALQATSLAKAANRSAPGGTSASYFGGMSINNPTRPDPSSGQEIMNGNPPFPPSGMSGFQAQQHLPNVSRSTSPLSPLYVVSMSYQVPCHSSQPVLPTQPSCSSSRIINASGLFSAAWRTS